MKKKLDKDKVKSFQEYTKSLPHELCLFGFQSTPKKYSNSIELYDFIPKYVWSKVKREKALQSKREILPHIERPFECRGRKYNLRLIPASIKGADGISRDYYPSKREELVEATLIKIASHEQGIFLDDAASVTFTLYQLQQQLKRQGHSYSLSQIKESLWICAGTQLQIVSESGDTVLASNMFETLGLQTLENWKGQGQKTKCFVRFNPLVTKSIQDKTFRLFNYEKNLSLDSVIARQLHRRMSHHFLQARITNTYTILLTTIIRDFGLTRYKTLSNNLRDVEIALQQMKSQDKQIIIDFTKEVLFDVKRSNKLADVKITIVAHPKFIADIIKGNERHKNILGLLPENSG